MMEYLIENSKFHVDGCTYCSRCTWNVPKSLRKADWKSWKSEEESKSSTVKHY